MAISIILVSSNSSEDSIWTSTGQVILFGTIPTTILDTTLSITPPATHIDTTHIPIVSSTIPPSPDYTPASPDYSPTFDTESDPSEDLSSEHIPPLPATSPFLSSIDDSSDNDILDTPPSPTHGTPFTETTISTQISHVSSGSVHMMTMRKRVGPLPTHRLVMRHSVDYSSSDHFTLDDLSSSSSSETSTDPSIDDLSNSSSDHSLPAPSSGMTPSHHLCLLVPSIPCSSAAIIDRPSHDSSSASLSCKRSRSLAAYILLSSPIPGALSYKRADILPSPKRIGSSEFATELEAEIDDCIAYVDSLRDRVIYARVVVKAVDREKIKTGARGLVKRFHDPTVEILVHRVQAIKVIQRLQGHEIVAIGQQSTDMLERIRELKRVNMRHKDMMDVVTQRVTRSQRKELRVQRELREIRRFRFYDRMRIARLEACARRHLGYRS
nr:hypothetical protein [Tanacetum cinerariifolium]